MAVSGSSAARQILVNSQLGGLLPLWGAASRHLQTALSGSRSSSSNTSSSSSSSSSSTQCMQQEAPQQPLHCTVHHDHQQQQQQQQQQQRMPGWLQQLSSSSRQDRLAVLSKLTITMQGQVADWKATGPGGMLSSAASLLPRAALAAAATAATAAAGPAGASLAAFQGSRYTGPNSLTEPGIYWLRQLNMEDKRVTALLLAANVLCFGMQQVSTTFTSYCVRVGYKIAQGEYWRLLTAAFVHGNVLHVGINMLALWNMGRMIEPQLGPGPFLTVYLGSAITGNLLGYWMSAGFAASLGSSSALFGLLGALLASSYKNRHSVYTSRAQVVSVLQTLGINLALMTLFGGHMDNWAHVGGFAGGALIGGVVAPRYRV